MVQGCLRYNTDHIYESHVLVHHHGMAEDGHGMAAILAQPMILFGFASYLSSSMPLLGFITSFQHPYTSEKPSSHSLGDLWRLGISHLIIYMRVTTFLRKAMTWRLTEVNVGCWLWRWLLTWVDYLSWWLVLVCRLRLDLVWCDLSVVATVARLWVVV